MPTMRVPAALLAVSMLLTLPAAAEPPAIVAACKSCHAEDGSGVGIHFVPVITGTPAVHIAEALYAYKDGARQCVTEPAMCQTVALLTDDNIAELAEHYSQLERPSLNEPFDAGQVDRGEQLHRKHCARCHVPPDDPDVADALGYPLHGQHPVYLRYALQAYLDGTREHLLEQMKEKMDLLEEGDVEALVNYYASY
ncbi:MAG: c-type cytochrome [Woeseiaceae bacterium]|nr:c-type cytochrome [Woeseiaceae bacterium]